MGFKNTNRKRYSGAGLTFGKPATLCSFIFIVLGYHLHEMDFEKVPDFSKRIKICSKGNACRMRFIWLS